MICVNTPYMDDIVIWYHCMGSSLPFRGVTFLWIRDVRMKFTPKHYTWMSRLKLGSMVRINGLSYNLLINEVWLGFFHPLILTINPNFQRDIHYTPVVSTLFLLWLWQDAMRSCTCRISWGSSSWPTTNKHCLKTATQKIRYHKPATKTQEHISWNTAWFILMGSNSNFIGNKI